MLNFAEPLTEHTLHTPKWKDICNDVFLAMGYGDCKPDDDIVSMSKEIYADIENLAIPRIMHGTVEAQRLDHKHISLGNNELTFSPGAIICSYLEGMTHIHLFVTTVGNEFDNYIRELKLSGNILKEFVADSIGTALAESCVDKISKMLDNQVNMKHSLPYSPGYCGWKICEQRILFSLFPENPCGISLSESCLMSPVKSVSGFFALGLNLSPQPYRCEICTNKHCYKKKHKIS